jgi:hypothetical protein
LRDVQRFRLTRWAVAIAQRDGRNSATLLPQGAIVEVMTDSLHGSPLREVKHEDELVMMFTSDLTDHTELIVEEAEEAENANLTTTHKRID